MVSDIALSLLAAFIIMMTIVLVILIVFGFKHVFRFRFVFAWYDLWFGVYIDRAKRRTYVMIPLVGFYVEPR